MSSRVEFPCPHTGEHCQQTSCPQTACLYDLDEAVWPDVEPDPQSLANLTTVQCLCAPPGRVFISTHNLCEWPHCPNGGAA